MKHLILILSLFATLSVGAQTSIVLDSSNACLGQSVTARVTVTGYGTDTLNFAWLQNGVGFGMPNNDTITYVPTVGSWNITVNVTTPGGQFIGTGFATITVNPNPTATASNGGPTCVTQTISLTAGGGSSYSWTGPNGFSSNVQNPTITQAQLVANGTYTVTVTDSLGCTADTTTSVVVNANPIPTISVSPNDTICLGTTVALFATGGVSYSWSMGGSGPSTTWTPTTTGNMVPSVFVTDANGCSAAEILPMVVHPTPSVTVGIWDVACFGDSTGSLSVSQSGLSYLWNTGATTQTISGLPAGNYSVTATNNFGCVATATATVTQPLATVTVDSLVIADALCNGSNDGSIGVYASGGVGFYSYSWTGNGTGGNPRTNLSAGTYTVTVTDGNSCSTTTTGTVWQPTILTANADSTPISCNGGNNGTAFVSFINGGTSPYTYVWSNGQTGSSISNLSVGTYTATITDANGCTVSAATAVTQPTAITLSAQVTPVTCNGGGNGSIDLSVSGGTSPYTYLWSTSSTAQDPQGLVAGTDTVVVTDANGCTATGAWVVSQPSALVLTTSTTDATCLANGSASVSVSGGTGPYNYSWSGNNGTNTSISAPAGNYTVTVTDANGCQAFDLVTIGTPVPVGVSDVITPIACYAGNTGAIDLTVTGVGPFTYTWSNGAITQDLTGLGWGNYSVIITAANGCDTTLSFSLSQPAPLAAQASATNASCFGGTGSATVLATGGTAPLSFSWSPSGGNGSTANNLPAGAYTVTVTDANGCSVQANTVVSEPSQMLAVISNQQNIACAGNSNGSATVSVVGGTPNYSLLWSTGAQTQTAYGLSAGSYDVTVTDANGCQATTTATISTTGSTLYANMTSDPSCGNSNTGSVTASVSGGQQPYVYQWSNGASSPSVSGLAPGTYSVTITDANGCSWQGSQQILGSSGIVINLSNQTLCQNNNELINATFTGGTWPYLYIWTTPSGNTFTTNNINPVEQGIYQLTIIDNFGCQASGSMYVTLIPCVNTGIEDALNTENVSISPNPISSGQHLMVELPLLYDDVTIQLFDVTGKVLLQEKASSQVHQLNTSGISSGTYMVRIANSDAVVTKRIIVK